MTSTAKLGSALMWGGMILVSLLALIPLSPVLALMFLAKWLHVEKVSPAACLQAYRAVV